MFERIAIIGATGAIGQAFVQHIQTQHPTAQLMTFSRGPMPPGHTAPHVYLDVAQPEAMGQVLTHALSDQTFDLVLVTTGMLHQEGVTPEKSLRDITAKKLQVLFDANAIFPALMMQHFIPKLATDRKAVFAVLSARVGSISDNRLGGWYSYRAAKAALNMLVKNASIETTRFHRQQLVVGLHPGTVASALSEPFQGRVPPEKLFTPDFAAASLWRVLEGLQPCNSGKCFAWDGEEILP